MAKRLNVGFIGFGNMAGAIAAALNSPVSRAAVKAAGYKLFLAAYDPDEEKVKAAPDGTLAVPFAKNLVEICDAVFVAVKPQAAKTALDGLDFSGKTLISIMAGVSLKTLLSLTNGTATKAVRVMPNMNARVGASYTVYCARNLSGDEERLIEVLLGTFGEVRCIEEQLMSASTGLCGSGPAFVFSFIDALIEAGKESGLDAMTAREAALQTVIGSAYYFESENRPAKTLIEAVCSKGGTTIEGIKHLDESDFTGIVKGAVSRSAKRAKELEEQNEGC